MTKGRMLNRTPKASLIGNDIVDARSTVITSITHDWNICCLCFHNYFYLWLSCKGIMYFRKKRKAKISSKEATTHFMAFVSNKSITRENTDEKMKTSANKKWIVK